MKPYFLAREPETGQSVNFLLTCTVEPRGCEGSPTIFLKMAERTDSRAASSLPISLTGRQTHRSVLLSTEGIMSSRCPGPQRGTGQVDRKPSGPWWPLGN